MVYRRNLINLFFLFEFVYLGISHPLRVVSKSLLMNFLFLIRKRERERDHCSMVLSTYSLLYQSFIYKKTQLVGQRLAIEAEILTLF